MQALAGIAIETGQGVLQNREVHKKEDEARNARAGELIKIAQAFSQATGCELIFDHGRRYSGEPQYLDDKFQRKIVMQLKVTSFTVEVPTERAAEFYRLIKEFQNQTK